MKRPAIDVQVKPLDGGRVRLQLETTLGPEAAKNLGALLLLVGSKLAGDAMPATGMISISRFDRGYLVLVPACPAEPAGARRHFRTLAEAKTWAEYRSLWLRIPVREVDATAEVSP